QTGHAGIHREATHVAADLAAERLEEDRPHGTRTDEVHLAADDVEELRNLVELRALQPASDPRVEAVAVLEQTGADLLLGADLERAEFVDGEVLAAAPHTVPAVEDRSGARRLRGEPDQ